MPFSSESDTFDVCCGRMIQSWWKSGIRKYGKTMIGINLCVFFAIHLLSSYLRRFMVKRRNRLRLLLVKHCFSKKRSFISDDRKALFLFLACVVLQLSAVFAGTNYPCTGWRYFQRIIIAPQTTRLYTKCISCRYLRILVTHVLLRVEKCYTSVESSRRCSARVSRHSISRWL